MYEPKRKWTLEEIQKVRFLRDEVGLGFPEIGRMMGIDYNKCRCIYHTGRKVNKVGIGEKRRQLGVTPQAFYKIRDYLSERKLPSDDQSVLDAIAGKKLP